MTNITTQAAQGNNPTIGAPTNVTFQIAHTKLCVPVVTLSTKNDKKLLKQLRIGFKGTIK